VLSVVVIVIRDRIADVAPALAMRTDAVLVDQPTETCDDRDVPELALETTAAVLNSISRTRHPSKR